MRGTLVLLVAPLLLGAACGRTEKPRATPSTAARGHASAATAAPAPAARAASAKASAAKPACIVPTPEQSPPVAHPAKDCPPDPLASPPGLPHGYVDFVDAPGKPRAAVELARTPDSRERGLMYRTHMPDDQGMLFSWNNDKIRRFWMHNTCIPLDMLFIARDGTIAGILEQVPTLNDDERSVPCLAAHVLELNAGWARSHGVKAGQKVEIEP
jgi:uncharacterized membrane protein (UPF0127 family)